VADKQPAQYLMVVQKVTSLSGESVQISINLPATANEDELYGEIKKICGALDKRMLEQNEKVLALTEATKQAFELEEAAVNGRMN
jgi:hypothetical protein